MYQIGDLVTITPDDQWPETNREGWTGARARITRIDEDEIQCELTSSIEVNIGRLKAFQHTLYPGHKFWVNIGSIVKVEEGAKG